MKRQALRQTNGVVADLNVPIVIDEPYRRRDEGVEGKRRGNIARLSGLRMVDPVRFLAAADEKFRGREDELLRSPQEHHQAEGIYGELYRLFERPARQRRQETGHPVGDGDAEGEGAGEHIGQGADSMLFGEREHDRPGAPGIGVGHRQPEDRRGTGEPECREDAGIERPAAEQA